MTDYMAGAKRAFGALTESAKTSFGPGATRSTVAVPIIAGIIGIALIAMIIIVIIQMKTNRPKQTLKGPIDLFKPLSPIVISRADTKANMSGTYTLSFYVRIDAVPDMRAAATPLFTWPGIWNLGYNAAQEQMVWTIVLTPDGHTGAIEPEVVVLPNVPLQRWTQISIGFEGRTMDLYVNGKLIKSDTLQNLPPSATSSITIVPGGIIGKLAYVQLWSRRLTVSQVMSNYTDTSDSQGRPFLGPAFFTALTNISVPNLFCPSGNCAGTQPAANPSQTWEFPYA